jgi:hypothetical protein
MRPFGFAGAAPNGAGVVFPRRGALGAVPSGAGLVPGRFVAGLVIAGFFIFGIINRQLLS